MLAENFEAGLKPPVETNREDQVFREGTRVKGEEEVEHSEAGEGPPFQCGINTVLQVRDYILKGPRVKTRCIPLSTVNVDGSLKLVNMYSVGRSIVTR
jgi:hypothetical protein